MLPKIDGISLMPMLRRITEAPVVMLSAKVEIDSRLAGLEMDLQTRSVARGGAVVELSAREFDLLAVLLRQPGRVFTRDQLIDLAWGEDVAVAPNAVETYISYLRGKMDQPPLQKLIHTIRRVGYSLR